MRTIPLELVEKYEREGWWTRETIADLLVRGLAAAPDIEFRVHSDNRPWAGTFRDIEHVARRMAQGLRDRGGGPGDAIAFQLPNCMEAVATFWAASFLGAVVVPIVHVYGRHEVTHILEVVKSRVYVSFLTIVDRTADLIIWGGENVSILEVEDVLTTIPGVAEAAAVAAHGDRLGEYVAAVLQLYPGMDAPTLEDICSHFAAAGLAEQKWSEELRIVTEFPRTASGKLQKYMLRSQLC